MADSRGAQPTRQFRDAVPDTRKLTATSPVTVNGASSAYLADDVAIALDSTMQDSPAIAGKYTPTITDTTNVESSSAPKAFYRRSGSYVFVQGHVTVDPTAAAATEIGISLPVASDLGAATDLSGLAVSNTGEIGVVIGDATNNRAKLNYTSAADTASTLRFSFAYEVI